MTTPTERQTAWLTAMARKYPGPLSATALCQLCELPYATYTKLVNGKMANVHKVCPDFSDPPPPRSRAEDAMVLSKTAYGSVNGAGVALAVILLGLHQGMTDADALAFAHDLKTLDTLWTRGTS